MDRIIKHADFMIQHGTYNDRVYVIKMAEHAGSIVLNEIEQILAAENYGKVFAKVSKSQTELFEEAGFIQEAMIPDYYGSGEDLLFMSKFVDSARSIDKQLEDNENVLETTFNKTIAPPKDAPDDVSVIKAKKNDAAEIAAVYKETFSSYPFPVFDPEYLKQMMSDNVDYYLAVKNGQLAAVSSAEKDTRTQTAEMTDFATREQFQGHQLAALLLKEMEKDLQEDNYRIAYTIARSSSVPMNTTFARAGYAYSGKLINNTNISGGIESMNIWYKNL